LFDEALAEQQGFVEYNIVPRKLQDSLSCHSVILFLTKTIDLLGEQEHGAYRDWLESSLRLFSQSCPSGFSELSSQQKRKQNSERYLQGRRRWQAVKIIAGALAAGYVAYKEYRKPGTLRGWLAGSVGYIKNIGGSMQSGAQRFASSVSQMWTRAKGSWS
jgi:hypothetical protein